MAAPPATRLAALVETLRATQWLPPDRLRAGQMQQLAALLQHAFEASGFHRERLSSAGYRRGSPVTPALLAALPVLTRSEVQDHRAAIECRRLPAGHGEPIPIESSGSTGAPVRVLGSGLTKLFWNALTVRSHEWNRSDLKALAAVINFFPKLPPGGARRPDWGPPMNRLFQTGPCVGMHIVTPVDVQARWLIAQQPTYLVTHPTNAMALAEWFLAHGERLNHLREVRTMSEAHPVDLRQACQSAWGARVADLYSSREAGIMAIECPHSGLYHVQSEHLIVEVLRDDGSPCEPGELGRVVVTNLHNYAFPLLRYDVGDLAEPGPPCGCGRHLPTLRRIAGRIRNMLVLPNGQTLWPSIAGLKIGRAAPIRQFQVVQTSLREVQVLLVADAPLDAAQAQTVRDIVAEALVHPFEITLSYRDAIPRAASGKFEEFKSLVPAPGRGTT